MAQLFSPSTNALARASLIGLFGALILIAALSVWLSRSEWSTGENRIVDEQPVPFSHAHHVGGIGIECRYCHRSVDTEAFAGLPPTQVCMHCHSQLWTRAEMLAPVRESYASGQRLHWRRVNDLPDFTYFDHSAHLEVGIYCAECHGEVSTMALTRRATPMTMRWCMDCHEQLDERYGLRNRTSCSTCHR